MENNNEVINQENKKYGKIFAWIILASCVVGGILGGVSGYIGHSDIRTGIENVYSIVSFASAYITVPMVIVATIVTQYLYNKGKKMYDNWEEDDEEQMKAIDVTLSYGLAVTSIILIVGYFLFALGILGLEGRDLHETFTSVGMLMCLGGLILNMIYTTVYQKKIVDLVKQMNPEKNGSIYDMKFHEKWEASCDEAELAQIHEAGYYAYKKANFCCIALWLFCVIGIYSFDFGIIPVSMVSIIWLVMTVSYNKKAIELSKR